MMKSIKIAIIMAFFLLAMLGGFAFSVWSWAKEMSLMSAWPSENQVIFNSCLKVGLIKVKRQ